ncbi:MAG: FlgD immunoglobulin-like domain containing protein, partial [Elusimicrobiota bacterium]
LEDATTGKCYSAGQIFNAVCPTYVPAAGSTAAWTFTPAPAALATGHGYWITARAVDVAGNVQNAFSVGVSSNLFYLDAAPPISIITTPAVGFVNALPFVGGTAQSFGGTSVSGVVVSIQNQNNGAYWNGSVFATTAPVFNAASFVGTSSGPWTYPSGGVPLTNGTAYQIQSRATDSFALAQAGVATFTFVLDNVPPLAAVTFPAQASVLTVNPTILGTAADPVPAGGAAAGVSAVAVSLQDAATGKCYSAAQAFTAACPAYNAVSGSPAAWTFTPVPSSLTTGHSYWITARGLDAAGNFQTAFSVAVSSVLFTYAVPYLGVSIQTPVPGAVYSSLPSVSGTSVDNVAVATVSLSVQQLGGLCYSPLAASFNAACPNAFPAGGTPSAWSYSSIQWVSGQQYTVTAGVKDPVGNVGASSATFTFAVSTGLASGAPGDGQGSATVTPAGVAGCQLTAATAAYTAGPAGIAPGGAVALRVPTGWTQPQGSNPGQPGYVSVASPGGYNLQFNPASLGNATLGTNWIVYVATTSLAAGQTVSFSYQGFPAQGASAQGPQVFAFEARGAGNGALVALSSSPAMNVAPGTPAYLSFVPSSALTLGQFQNSPSMQVQLWDNCGEPTVQTGSPLPVNLQALIGAVPDAKGNFYAAAGGSPVQFVSVPAGGGLTAPFFFNTSTAGVALEALAASANLFNGPASVARPVDLLAAAASITGASVDNGALGSAATTSIAENGPTASEAFINFTLSNPSLSWEVIISSNPATFVPRIADFNGIGNPGRTLTWSGLNSQTSPPQFLPAGVYYVEIIAGGGSAVNTALSISLAPSPSIYGVVTNGPGAKVVAVGPNVLSGNSATADSGGGFRIYGLQAGTSYLVETSTGVLISSSVVTVTASVNGVVASAAGTNAGSLTFAFPSLLNVAATLPFPAPSDISGTVSVHDAAFAHAGSGTLHFFPGAKSSDNGAQAFGVDASTLTAIALPPGTYEADVSLPALGVSTSVYGVVVGAGSPSFVTVALQKLVNLYGFAILPARAAANTWVSVSASNPAGASVLGGVSVPVSASSAVYSLFGLSAGAWTVTADAPGVLPASTTVLVAGSADIGSLAAGGVNLTMKNAGSLSGVLTVVGNTASANMSATCPGGAALCVPVTAYDATNFVNAAVTVVLATSTTQTSGSFSFAGVPDGLYSVSAALNGFSGAGQNATVASGAGAVNLSLSANNSKTLVTVVLPPGSHPSSDFKSVSLGCSGSQGSGQSFPDMTSGTSIQYFPSSATVVLTGLNADLYQFQAFNAATGMYRSASASLGSNGVSSVLLDLSSATCSVSGTFSLSANLTLPSGTGASVTISSVPGLLANTGRMNYCLLGYAAPPSLSAAHLELLPAGSAGTFAGGPLATSGSGGCPANLISPASAGTAPNPYLAYAAAVGADGGFAFSGVPPGVYLLRNNNLLDGAGDRIPQFSQTVVVTGTVAGLVFQVGSGSVLSGSVLAQAGVSLRRSLKVNLMDAQGQLTASAPVVFNNSNSASYSFSQVVNGNYTVVLQDSAYPKAYASAPLQVQMTGSNLSGQNLSVVPSGTIKCRVAIREPSPGGGVKTRLIVPGNAGLLPSSFQIQAAADPWFSGGLGAAGGPSAAGVPVLDANGEFVIDGLLPGAYDVKFLAASGGAGAVALVNSAVPGVVVTADNVTDVGVVELGGGVELSGKVVDATTNLPVANLRVHAAASLRGSGVASSAVEAVTDGSGRYVLAGLDPTVRFYDVYAAFRGVEVQGESLPPYEQTISPSVDVSTVSLLNFTAAPAAYSVTGRVLPAAGGPALGIPAAGGQTAQAALIYFQKSGVIPVSNPIADIQFQTDYSGNFTIPSVATGTYLMTATSLGYASQSRLVTIATAPVNVGSLTMTLGATLTGSLTNSDGSNPSYAQVGQIIAVTSDLSNILIGSLATNPNTQTVTGYTIAGFKTGLAYHVILLDAQNGVVAPPEASAVVFASTAAMRVNIVYRPVAPLVIAVADRSGSGFRLEFDMSQPLRAVTSADDDLPGILAPVSAAGTLSSLLLSQDRTRLTAFYTPGVSESSFTFHVRGYSTLVNPNSTDPINPQFPCESTVTFYNGIDGLGQTNVGNLQGGDVLVQGNNGRITLPPGSLNVAVSSSVLITLQVADEPLTGGTSTAGLPAAAARLKAMRFAPQAYPTEILAAAAAVPPSINPLSAFYNIFLPLGVNTALSKPAQLTLAYSTAADPSTLNLYWFNPAAGNYVLQQDVTGAPPVINAADHTITLNVGHFSTYVLFNSAQAVLTGATGATVLQVDNFPNPFDLGAKMVTPLHAGTSACGSSCFISGTMIGISVPPGASGDATIRIFNVAGTLVRSISVGDLQGGTYYYQNWDGTNDSGRPVASGAYIGELKIDGRKTFFRMAVVKGSGL